jgi:hypothetical protein
VIDRDAATKDPWVRRGVALCAILLLTLNGIEASNQAANQARKSDIEYEVMQMKRKLLGVDQFMDDVMTAVDPKGAPAWIKQHKQFTDTPTPRR